MGTLLPHQACVVGTRCLPRKYVNCYSMLDCFIYYVHVHVLKSQYEPARIVDINFTQPKRLRESLLEEDNDEVTPAKKAIPSPSFEERKSFIDTIQTLLPRSAILNVSTLKVGPRSRHTVAKTLPPTIQSFAHQRYSSLGKEELHAECEVVFNQMKISQDEAHYLSEATCLQSQSILWFEHRKGRITASLFGAVCRTSIQLPSLSLLNKILQRTPMVKAAALDWGISKENTAKSAYVNAVRADHTSFAIRSTGLHLNPDYPHLGASPDGLIFCSCCGNGLLEIKCPYSKRHLDPTKVVDASFYLKPTTTGLKLSRSHDYYKQVQGQLEVCQRDYCDFVCWTPMGMHIERIQRDPSFFEQMKPKLEQFFLHCVLPNILCPSSNATSNKENVYCFCQKGEFGRMIACDNSSCKYQWFHFECVNIEVEPDGQWYCPDCRP